MAEALFSDAVLKELSINLKGGDPYCVRCGLDRKGCISPRMEATGSGKIPILFVAEAPGAKEDVEGKQLVGKAGQLLRRELRNIGVKLDDCRKINAVNCRPPDNETPLPEQIECCRPMVFAEIERLKPVAIIALGKTALESLIGHRYFEGLGALQIWRGRAIPDRGLRTWIYPTFHPSYVGRMSDLEIIIGTFARDLQKAFAGPPFKINWEENLSSQVNIIKNEDEIKDIIKKFTGNNRLTGLDYETTGKKPFAPGHKIWSVALYNKELGCYSFPYYHSTKLPLSKFLKSDTPKTAHNAKFEELWSQVIVRTRINNMVHCSMQGAHTLDNRRGTKALKFLSFVTFGYSYWAGDVDKYLKVPGKGANGLNRIHEANLDDVLLYGGIDTITQVNLARLQMRMLDHE